MDYSSYKFYRGEEECPENSTLNRAVYGMQNAFLKWTFKKAKVRTGMLFLRNAKLAEKRKQNIHPKIRRN